MTFFDQLARLGPGWPNERQAVTLGLFGLAVLMLFMAYRQASLWEVKLFEISFQAVLVSGVLNMVSGFHFSANKNDETKAANTRAAFEAISAAARSGQPPAHENDEGRR